METNGLLQGLFVLLSGEEPPVDPEAEIREATRELEAALAALRTARGRWTGPETLDLDAVRRALDHAERQLDAARVRLAKAEKARKG